MEQTLSVLMFQSHTAGMEAPGEGSGCLMSALPLEVFVFLVIFFVVVVVSVFPFLSKCSAWITLKNRDYPYNLSCPKHYWSQLSSCLLLVP